MISLSAHEKDAYIPKRIFYCWFGGKPLNNEQKKCINSWRKFLPTHEIIEINESNFPFSDTKFGRVMHDAKLFSYLTDYIRLRVIYENGGLYFDTDVELIAGIDDLLGEGPFFGESGHLGTLFGVATGLGFACGKGHPLLRQLMLPYEEWHGENAFSDNGFPLFPNCVTFNTPVFIKWGFRPEWKNQIVNGVHFYTPDYFEPISYADRVLRLTPNTRSIHYYTNSANHPLDRWYFLEKAKLYRKKGHDISHRRTMLILLMLHPFRTMRFRLLHRKAFRKK